MNRIKLNKDVVRNHDGDFVNIFISTRCSTIYRLDNFIFSTHIKEIVDGFCGIDLLEEEWIGSRERYDDCHIIGLDTDLNEILDTLSNNPLLNIFIANRIDLPNLTNIIQHMPNTGINVVIMTGEFSSIAYQKEIEIDDTGSLLRKIDHTYLIEYTSTPLETVINMIDDVGIRKSFSKFIEASKSVASSRYKNKNYRNKISKVMEMISELELNDMYDIGVNNNLIYNESRTDFNNLNKLTNCVNSFKDMRRELAQASNKVDFIRTENSQFDNKAGSDSRSIIKLPNNYCLQFTSITKIHADEYRLPDNIVFSVGRVTAYGLNEKLLNGLVDMTLTVFKEFAVEWYEHAYIVELKINDIDIRDDLIRIINLECVQRSEIEECFSIISRDTESILTFCFKKTDINYYDIIRKIVYEIIMPSIKSLSKLN